MRGRRLEKTAGVFYYTRPPQALSHPPTPRLPRQALCRGTRSFTREYVEGARCDE
jgi:hypothetical protein